MSGGVDSSVAAKLLLDQGYDVTGLFMRVGVELPAEQKDLTENTTTKPCATRPRQGCCSADDAADARYVAGMLGIPFYALNFKDEFEPIIEYFVDEYAQGRTPNPCIICNDLLKFGKLFEYAEAAGARYVATGHYARIATHAGKPALFRGKDSTKDQSYVLSHIRCAALGRMLLPLGELVKTEVRALAARHGFPNQDKADSVEICFVPDQDYARLVAERRPEAFVPGEVRDAAGKVLGTHRGLPHYTIGQRRGLGISAPQPIYVTELNLVDNSLIVGEKLEVFRTSLTAERVNFLVDPPRGSFRAKVQIRYQHTAASATVEVVDGERLHVHFDEPQLAVTPGQAAVIYDDDLVIGGGWICE